VKQPAFADLLATAQLHKGGRKQVISRLPTIASPDQLAEQPNAFYLSAMSRRVFQAGLKHEMVNKRWPAFEQAFSGFDVTEAAMMSDEALEGHMGNRALIRHLPKMKSIRLNAAMILATSREHGSFGQFLAQWPVNEIVELWFELKRVGSQLGGMSAPAFLRRVGKDTFLMTNDVVAVLKAHGIIDKPPTSKRDLRTVQQVFNQWQQESGWPLSHISRMISFTTA
jgi:3-methyladenine DNA glycosylase Tag